MKKIVLALLLLSGSQIFAQAYTSYFTGNATDIITNPSGGVCLMGGATEHDEAMKWFLLRSNGGDILVLRASGSNGYNNYLYSGLGVTVNSVETIVFNNATAAEDPYVQQKVSQAEAIWFAGGD
ncbi:MAG TPA: cyanophycinase, partial [Bacteroidia bacterium]